MLTLKVISEETERVIRGLEKKHFNNARETIENVLDIDDGGMHSSNSTGINSRRMF